MLSNLDYKVDNEYGRSRHGENFAKERYQNNGRPFEYEMDKYPNLYEGVLIDKLCTNATQPHIHKVAGGYLPFIYFYTTHVQ